MKKFIVKATIFILPLLLAAFFFEYHLAKIPNSYNKKREYLEARLDSIEVLILGNSRSLFAINPSYLRYNAYNLSNISQTMYYNKELGMKYIPKMPNLKYVVIEVTPGTFGVTLYDGIERWRDFYYSQFWDIRYPEIPWYEIKHYSKFFLYQPLRSIYYASLGFNVNHAEALSPNGWQYNPNIKGGANFADSLAQKRAKFTNSVFRSSRVAENVANLDQLVALITGKNIKCVLLTSPVYPTFSKHLSKANGRLGRAAVEKICAKYHSVYYNYLDDPRFVEEDYADCDHFNFRGAEKYSRIIDTEIFAK